MCMCQIWRAGKKKKTMEKKKKAVVTGVLVCGCDFFVCCGLVEKESYKKRRLYIVYLLLHPLKAYFSPPVYFHWSGFPLVRLLCVCIFILCLRDQP